MIGTDLSSHQEGVTIAELKAKGLEFVIIKATQGTHYVNPFGAAFYSEACAEGLPAGAYCYSEATTPQQAQLEAYYLLERIRGCPMPCGVWLDVEDPEQLRMDAGDLTEAVRAWCEVIRAAGYVPGVYSSEHSAWAKLDRDALGDDVLVWVARYGRRPDMPCDLWQYTDREPIQGHECLLDLDVVTPGSRLETMLRAAQEATSEPAADGKTPDISGALALLAAYLQTEEFARGFREFLERRCDPDGTNQ